MRLNNIEYVVEVIKPKDRPTTVGLKLLSQKEREDHIRVNNSYLCESGVNLHDVAYRMALVLGCDLSDDALRTNCVVSTWFTTGQAKWILKSCLCQTGQWLANLLPLPQRVSKTAGAAITSEDMKEAQFKGGATQLPVRESWIP